ncbi:MAG: SDR family oxidoreductase [Halobacteriales archaeon]
MELDLDLDGNVALITGSATGLGHAVAEVFSRQGAHVALASKTLDDLAHASDRLYAIGDGEVFGLEADVRDPDQVTAFVENTIERYGGIDHLVTGPRPVEPETFAAVSDEDWFRAFDRQFMSVVWTVRAALSWLEESEHGTVVNVTNPVVRALGEQFPVANSFGRAVEGMTETGAKAFAPSVRMNSILPGPHDTDDMEQFLSELVDAGAYDDLEDAWDAVLADAPFDEPGDPLDVGKLVAFLSSDHAGFVNGVTVPVDGGARL